MQEHFFLHTRLPCCLVFKKASASITGMRFLSLDGRCSDCGSVFHGVVDSVPAVDTRLVLFCLNLL